MATTTAPRSHTCLTKNGPEPESGFGQGLIRTDCGWEHAPFSRRAIYILGRLQVVVSQ